MRMCVCTCVCACVRAGTWVGGGGVDVEMCPPNARIIHQKEKDVKRKEKGRNEKMGKRTSMATTTTAATTTTSIRRREGEDPV